MTKETILHRKEEIHRVTTNHKVANLLNQVQVLKAAGKMMYRSVFRLLKFNHFILREAPKAPLFFAEMRVFKVFKVFNMFISQKFEHLVAGAKYNIMHA
jgi:hypothetical protein